MRKCNRGQRERWRVEKKRTEEGWGVLLVSWKTIGFQDDGKHT